MHPPNSGYGLLDEKRFRPVFKWVKDPYTGVKRPRFSGLWMSDEEILCSSMDLPDDAILDVVWEEGS